MHPQLFAKALMKTTNDLLRKDQWMYGENACLSYRHLTLDLTWKKKKNKNIINIYAIIKKKKKKKTEQ
jgi:hypothetical protein